MGQNTCSCPNPPGGEVTCGDHQVAICRVEDGKVRGSCIDVPDGIATLTELREAIIEFSHPNFVNALSLAITGSKYSGIFNEAIELAESITTGRYTSSDGVVAWITLPEDISSTGTATA